MMEGFVCNWFNPKSEAERDRKEKFTKEMSPPDPFWDPPPL